MRATQFDEINENDGISHHDPRSGHKTDHRGRREKSAQRPMRGQNADQRKRDRRHHHERGDVTLEPTHHEHRDQHQHGSKREAEVPKYLQGNMPLAVPFQRGLAVVEREIEVKNGERCRPRAKRAGIQLADFAVEAEKCIGRTLHDAGNVGGHIRDRLEVFAI